MRLAVRLCAVALALATGLGCPPNRPPVTGPPGRPLVAGQTPRPAAGLPTWPRMRAVEFGCLLQTRFGARDPRWNCARPDPGPAGDPCGDTRAYYDGPAFPRAAAGAVAPGVLEVTLAWEHRDLQSAVFVLDGVLPEAEARRRLGLPAAGAPLPPNVQAITVQRCATSRTCVDLVGFDHLGAADVECPP
jgi:hypothetical protein